MSALTIYKASAGSGKTFKLTEEYLRLLFAQPSNYKRILAVTFTNRATEEMKLRIISELNKIAGGEETPYSLLFINELNISRIKIQELAMNILKNLLHDYSKFSVYTIDSFFQNITKAFSREIGLFSGYKIELEHDEILDEAVDDLLANSDENPEIKMWLTDFVKSKISEGRSWDIKQDIISLGKYVFVEKFREYENVLSLKINDKSFLNDYSGKLKNIKKEFSDQMSAYGKKAMIIMEKYALEPTDFKQGAKGVGMYFYHISEKSKFSTNSYIEKAYENKEEWYTAKSPKIQIIINAVDDGLFELLKEIIDFYNAQSCYFYSVDTVLKNLFTLGLLSDISKRIREITRQKNIFLLSDTAMLLKTIINEDDAPFVYEKTGNYYRNFMIDEFQDTSVLQWNNFRPLIINSLSEDNKSLVVGDVKQSIYRWRNSNWKLLAEQLDQDFINYGTKEINLDYNWRSRENIIKYNNTVFQLSANVLQSQINAELAGYPGDHSILMNRIVEAYKTVFQNSPKNADNGGGVILNYFIPDHEENEWEKEALMKLPEIIEGVQRKGYKAKDIAFIVRKKEQGKEIADFLLNYKNTEGRDTSTNFDFISNEALYIGSSESVQFILAVLNFFLNPDDIINKAFMLYFIQPEKSVHECLGGLSKDPEFFIGSLPGEFVRNQEKYKKLSLYEMVENIISVFSFDQTKKDLIYLLGFQNIVQQYVSENTSDLHSFIEWWNKKGISKTLSVSQDIDAMRIITVHKAKGLEFKVVIMPFCDWDLDHDSHLPNILWCKTDKEPFNELPLLPVKYSKDLSKTIFLNDYISEKLDAYIDNLNLLYVAFTRAMDQLITISPEVPIKGEIKSTGGLLKFLIDKPEINTHPENIKLSEFYKPDKNLLEIPSDFSPKDKHKETTGIKLLNYYTNTSNKPLKIRRQSSEFFNLSDQQKNRISKGRILHSVFENIIIEQDIETAVRRAENEGIVSFSEIDEIKQIISDAFKNPMVKNWFSEENKVLNEVSILLPGNVQKRPDRVILKDNEVHVIDYKFGEQNPSYNDQVKEYCEILNQMGYIKVRGYIWYVMDNLIVEI